jgi:hypothetical protein
MIAASVGVKNPPKIPNKIITVINSAQNADLKDLNISPSEAKLPLG